MKVIWNKKRFLILFVLIFSIGYVNNMAIIMLNLNVFQMIVTTTICIIICIAILWILYKHGFLGDETKNDGDIS